MVCVPDNGPKKSSHVMVGLKYSVVKPLAMSLLFLMKVIVPKSEMYSSISSLEYLAMNVIQVYGIRIGFVLAATPLFFLLYVLAGVDGLTERYIRRACAGRESADLHKIGRLAKLMFFASGVTLYLCLPVAMSPFWVIAPLALVFAVSTRVQWQFYKKYF